MTADPGSDATSMLSPTEAFSVLGDETRLVILQVLGEADGPLAFSELFDRVDYHDPSNFNYHLKRLTGHFVHKTGEGYVLRQGGRRVVEAVLAEAVGDDAEVPRMATDVPCFQCGSPIEVTYRRGHVGEYCPACGGTRDGRSRTTLGRAVDDGDILGLLDLPPAGAVDRTPTGVVEAGRFWTTHEAHAIARDVCPRCAAPLEYSSRVCEDHDATDGHCEACGQRFAVMLHHHCTNCIYGVSSPVGTYLLDSPALLGFLGEMGVDPLALPGFHIAALSETILSTDPFRARFTFTADEESLTLTVDEAFAVVAVSRDGTADSSGG